MKITVNLECTPEEARAFLGLPDVAGLHKMMLDDFQEKLKAGLKPFDLEQQLKVFMAPVPGIEQLTKLLNITDTQKKPKP